MSPPCTATAIARLQWNSREGTEFVPHGRITSTTVQGVENSYLRTPASHMSGTTPCHRKSAVPPRDKLYKVHCKIDDGAMFMTLHRLKPFVAQNEPTSWVRLLTEMPRRPAPASEKKRRESTSQRQGTPFGSPPCNLCNPQVAAKISNQLLYSKIVLPQSNKTATMITNSTFPELNIQVFMVD